MAQFPSLKTGAAAQYPAVRAVSRPVSITRYIDGSEQRFRRKRQERRWVLRLEDLEEGELAAVEGFYLDHQGEGLTFDFVDPFRGEVVTGCRFGEAPFEQTFEDSRRGRATITVVESGG